MNRIVIIITFLLLGALCIDTPIALSQSGENDPIAKSIKSGSSRELSRYFGSSVELTINGNQGDYSKNQAEVVMKDFFKKFSPTDFKIVHKGKSGNQIQHLIGTYKSKNTDFRVLIKTKVSGKSTLIYSMEINRE